MILDDDRVKVTDFGIARILSVDTMMGTVATTGMRVGTPLYMSPEQVRGKNIDARSDVYGFGAVLYHMVTGRPPFEGDDALAIAVQQMNDEPVPPSSARQGLPRDWDTLILKSLNKDPRRRFQSIKEMKRSIEELGTHPASRPSRLIRKPWYTAAAAVALVAVLLGSLLGYSSMPGHASAATLSSYLSGAAAEGQLSGTVLVAKKGKVILDQGYGMANRAAHIPNGPNTEYGLADATTTALLTGDIRELFLGVLGSKHDASICQGFRIKVLSYPCPARWEHHVMITQLLDGTTRLPEYHWGRPGNTIAQTEAACASMPLERRSPHTVHYTTCANVVMGLFGPAALNTTQEGGSWLPFGLGPNGDRHYSIAFERRMAGQFFDGLRSPKLALDYDRAGNHSSHTYNDYYAAYTSAPHLYFYDNLLFSGRYMNVRANTKLELRSRGIAAPSDPGINGTQWADAWKTGYLFGSRLEYTAGNLYNYQTANLRFPRPGVTVIVMGNTASTEGLNIAEHAAAFVLPGHPARLATTGPMTTRDLLGTYYRKTRPGDYRAVNYAVVTSNSDGLPWPYNGNFARMKLTLTIKPGRFRLGDAEVYTAGDDRELSLSGPPPGLTTTHLCNGQNTDLTPTGYYRWSILGRVLTITKVSDNHCADRAELVPGTWIRTGKPAS